LSEADISQVKKVYPVDNKLEENVTTNQNQEDIKMSVANHL
jgi:hypothetical protein